MNTYWLEKFEEYLHGEMSNEEKLLFEAELSSNEEMNKEFRLYQTIETEMRQHIKQRDHEKELKNSLQSLGTKHFKTEKKQTRTVSFYDHQVFKIATSIAASIIVIITGYFIFFQPAPTTQYLAEDYFSTHLEQLSQTMDATQDSLQMGISAYNNKEYDKALQFFQGVLDNQPDNSEAIKNKGLVYLATEEYEQALQQFDELSGMEGLYYNEGNFLKAVTLMKRNKIGDKQEAKNLLEQVVREEAAGSRQAKEWLERF